MYGPAFADVMLRAYRDMVDAVGLAASRVAPPTIEARVGDRVTPTGILVLEHSAPRSVRLDKRREGIGSSDLPAVMQLSGYRSPQHVYYDKRGEIPHDDDEDMGDPARYGVLFEEPLAFDWARRNRTVVESVGIVAHRDEPWQMCSLDRLCAECPLDRDKHSLCALEVKCRNAFVAKLWRQGPPDDVLAQVLWQILVTGLDHIHVVCLIGGNDYRQYTCAAASTRSWWPTWTPRPPACGTTTSCPASPRS